jgi:hypothetical protein
MSHRVVWIFVVLVFSLGWIALAMDADADPLTRVLDSESSATIEAELAKCCGSGPPPCRATGPQSPLTTSLHLRARVR